jgi:uncharacterized protein YjbI with pentapeptide repeats
VRVIVDHVTERQSRKSSAATSSTAKNVPLTQRELTLILRIGVVGLVAASAIASIAVARSDVAGAIALGVGAAALAVIPVRGIIGSFRRAVTREDDRNNSKVDEPEGVRAQNVRRAGTGRQLQGVDLVGAHLINAQLRASDLIDARLDRALLSHSTLDHALLTGASLVDADLRHASLDSADLRRADLRRADLTGAKLTHANLKGARLQGALLRDASLDEATLTEADFRQADLTSAALTGASMVDADLRGLAKLPRLSPRQRADVITDEVLSWPKAFARAADDARERRRNRRG